MKEIQPFSPVQMQRALQLERVSSTMRQTQDLREEIQKPTIWRHYSDESGHLQTYAVTPQVTWGMRLVRRALFEDLGDQPTAEAIVEKYLGERETL